MNFNLNLLSAFYSIYQTRNLTKSARELGLAPSTLSSQLKTLRRLYGDPLFVTEGRSLQPTTTAQSLYPLVAEALEQCQKALPAPHSDRTSVVIAMSDDFELVLGKHIANAFEERLPEAFPIIVQTNTLLVKQALLTRKAQFAVTGGGARDEPQLVRESFGVHYDCCLYDKTQISADCLDLETYLQKSHIAVHFGSHRGVADGYLYSFGEGLHRHLALMTSHYSALPQYLVGTGRIALVPVWIARHFQQLHPTLTFCKLPFPISPDPIELAYRNDSLKQPLMQSALQILRSVMHLVDWTEMP